ncbi:hypothetical protein RB623_24450 [Mesorhizobium sp. LHD-90]|uniref:hypothetical protein n=1 Tax=Mesorhizobium sp. LHD-90 TaxID=3071414 RepID=UPI0027E0BB00|nr:hypothetical protein [Mesorhizobium sp. LHD-90]MDQ6437215.1 hypothetical protein [Mesorhizobium sp. LHD-90]
MGEMANRDFAVLLDELIAARDQSTGPVAAPTIPFDYLSVAEELYSGRIQVSDDAVEAEYREASEGEPETVAAETVGGAGSLPSVEPEAIAVELGLDRATAADFTRIRRRFAFANHPDRVAPHLRERAMVRMKIANMLIDAASGKAAAMDRR